MIGCSVVMGDFINDKIKSKQKTINKVKNYLLNPASLANQEMLISTIFLVWYGSKTFSKVGEIKFLPL